MRRAIAAVLLCGLGAAVVTAGPKIQAQRDPKFDFSTLKTWAWNPSGPGDVKVWVSAESKSEPVKRTYEPVIMKAVEDELARRGLARATGTQADFNVTYYVLITAASDTQQMGQFLPAVAQAGCHCSRHRRPRSASTRWARWCWTSRRPIRATSSGGRSLRRKSISRRMKRSAPPASAASSATWWRSCPASSRGLGPGPPSIRSPSAVCTHWPTCHAITSRMITSTPLTAAKPRGGASRRPSRRRPGLPTRRRPCGRRTSRSPAWR